MTMPTVVTDGAHLPASSKRSKQSSSSASSAAGDDAPFLAHRTHRTLVAHSTPCPCGLSTRARTLVLGDGDLSYSVGLVRHLVSDAHIEHPEVAIGGASSCFDNFTSEADAHTLRAAAPAALAEYANGRIVDVARTSSLQLTCSTYEEVDALSARYTEARANAALLRSWGIKVLHGVDARRLEQFDNLMPHATARMLGLPVDEEATVAHCTVTSSDSSDASDAAANIIAPAACTFHQITFHFPHVGGKSRIHLNRGLLIDFLRSATTCLVRRGDAQLRAADDNATANATADAALEVEAGCIHVSLIRGQGGTPYDTRKRPGYGDHWQLLECATHASLVLTHVFPFIDGLYAGYNNRGFRSRDEEFYWRGVAITHVLTPGAADVGLAQTSATVRDLTRSLSPDIQRKIDRDLCRVPHHPLRQVASFISDFSRAPRAPVAHLTRRPFVELNEPIFLPASTIADTERVADNPSSLSATADNTDTAPTKPLHTANSLFSHVSTSPCVPIISTADPQQVLRPDMFVYLPRLLRESSSYVMSGAVFESCADLDSLQWNLDPVVSVAADMEKEVPQPICVRLAEQARVAKAVTPMTTETIPVVPMMRGGVPVMHHQLVLQQFLVDAPHADTNAILEADCAHAATECMRAMFSADMPTRVAPSSYPCVLRVSSDSDSVQPTEVRLGSEVQLQFRGVWHAVAKAGTFVSSSSPRAGWLLEWSLEKLCMIRFEIGDSRWLWSRDQRFLRHFEGDATETNTNTDTNTSDATSSFSDDESHAHRLLLRRSWHRFVPFSLHPLCYVRDHSFWLHPRQTQATAAQPNHHAASNAGEQPHAIAHQGHARESNTASSCASSSHAATAAPSSPLHAAAIARTFTSVVQAVLGDELCCSVTNTDNFFHPQRGAAMRFRCILASVDSALAPQVVLRLQTKLQAQLVAHTGVEMR